jgi:hypothetical protein
VPGRDVVGIGEHLMPRPPAEHGVPGVARVSRPALTSAFRRWIQDEATGLGRRAPRHALSTPGRGPRSGRPGLIRHESPSSTSVGPDSSLLTTQVPEAYGRHP